MPPPGWQSKLPAFSAAPALQVREALEAYVQEVSLEQRQAWDASIPPLQDEARAVLDESPDAREYGLLLEYRLPYESRRPDVVLLACGTVVVLELKGKRLPSQADLDQVAAYARDLRAYHRACAQRSVCAVLVPTRAGPEPYSRDGVLVVGPSGLRRLLDRLPRGEAAGAPTLEEFCAPNAYRPLPTLVEAARELLVSGTLREVWKAKALTDPAVEEISAIAHEAARTRTRHLVLVTGVPGAGKTLVGMRAVHARYLDDLAVARPSGKPTAPGLYLSGNGPLVEVLQYEMRKAGGGGRTFVRHIKSYLDHLVPRAERVPEEHVLVFDEAQRAFSADMVADKHPKWPLAAVDSEPALFLRLCERMPKWSVMVGLIGGGQEIHIGEEDGLGQWRDALLASDDPTRWTVHAPATVQAIFEGSSLRTRWNPALNLDTEIRFHLASDLHGFVSALLEADAMHDDAAAVAERLWTPRNGAGRGIRLWATRDLEAGKDYLRERYRDRPETRFGLLASSRDKLLPAFGIENGFQATKNVRIGRWFCEGEEDEESCRKLDRPVTEFQAQGLELDMALACWGQDLIREGGQWTHRHSRAYRPRGRTRPRDPFQMRVNAYRVLLTRGRDGTVVFVPPHADLDETWEHLLASGFRELA